MWRRENYGLAFPSPLVFLSILAIAMAGIAYVATRGQPSDEREIAVTSRHSPTAEPTPSPTQTLAPKPPPIKRDRVYVEVYNNSGVSGLASTIAAKASGAGWQVVGSDNWYGTIPASTVYYPQRLKAEARLLALDLGIRRVQPAIEPMRMDRLTVILTADAQ